MHNIERSNTLYEIIPWITRTRTTCVNCNSDKVIHDANYRYFVLLRGKALTISSEATAITYPSPLFRNHKFVKNCTHLPA